jgi:glycosyltransferase involved in cell wall biosynthesis
VELGTVAVVVRTKDRPVLLARALDDVAAQTLVAERPDRVKVVVVNDGGDADRLRALVTSHALSARITVVDNPSSLGRWPAANQGIAAVASDYLVLHDDDDTWQPGFLAATTRFLDAPEHARYAGVVVFSDVVHEAADEEGYRETGREPFAREIQHISLIEMCRRNQFPPIAYLYRRSVHEVVGAYNESMNVLADWDFNLRVVRKFDLGMITEHLANWHVRDGAAGEADANVTYSRNEEYVEQKVLLFNRLLREDLDQGSLGLGYLTNLFQVIDREEQHRDSNVHLHLEHAIAQLKDHTTGVAAGSDAAIAEKIESARQQLLAKPNSLEQLSRGVRRSR